MNEEGERNCLMSFIGAKHGIFPHRETKNKKQEQVNRKQ